MITLFEELSLNAWPAREVQLFDGWVLRANGGYTRRANCANPLYPGELPLAEKIAACERYYRQQGLPVIFKLTPASQPAGLDAALEQRGYAHEADTVVQTLSLQPGAFSPDPAVSLSGQLEDEWFAAFNRLGGSNPAQQEQHARILRAIQPARAYAALRVAGQIAACGLAIVQEGYAGFFDVLVDRELRRQGLGLRLMGSLLAWGQAQGARTAYLQVMQDNQAALNLYARLGFTPAYPYWYRVKKLA